MNIIKILTLNNLFRYKLILIAVVITAVLLTACNNKIIDPPPDEEPLPILKDSINLAIEDVTHRSITLNLSAIIKNPKTKSLKLFREFNGTKNILTELYDTTVDTSIIDDNNGEGLLLDTVYTYYAITTDSTGAEIDTSKKITGRTLAPTSHNYIWEEITIGDGQSYLTDVWGTDENNVYAVGYIRMGEKSYSILHYDGINWTPIEGAGGTSIFGFSPSDIWVIGGTIFHFNGVNWTEILFRDTTLVNNIPYTSLWGTSSSNMYFGTARGKIIHWDGSKAREVYNSNTSIPVKDLYGKPNNFIIGVGSSLTTPSIGFYYNGINWKTFEQINFNNVLLRSTLIINAKNFYLCGSRNYEYSKEGFNEILIQAPGIIEKIRRNEQTGEIVVVGGGFTLLHFNGITWKDFSYELNKPNSSFFGVYIIKNKIFAVGSNAVNSSIFIGTKN